ncbi:MAG: THUMP domain-containing protein [Pseudomonadota bacterium]
MTLTQQTIRKKAGEHQRYASGFTYQKDGVYFAQIAEDLIQEGVKELTELGATQIIPSIRGIHFAADKATFYKVNYMSRLASRILAPLVAFPCPDTDTLYRQAKQIRWETLFKKKSTFAIFSNVSDSSINHSQFASLRLKDSIVDYFRDLTGKRPDVDTQSPDIQINLHIRKDMADISIDASGGALHKRGYREETITAPMQETVAAAIIRLSGWDGSLPLYDPMCGSGTLLCESLMQYCRIPAGSFRTTFGFEYLPDFNPDIWDQVKADADAGTRNIQDGTIAGSDLDPRAVRAARINLMGLHNGNSVSVEQMDFRDLPSMPNMVLVANPPYGIRMGKEMDLKLFHKEFGDFLKQKCTGSTAYVYFGDTTYMGCMGLKASWKKDLKAGGLEGKLARYELY